MTCALVIMPDTQTRTADLDKEIRLPLSSPTLDHRMEV